MTNQMTDLDHKRVNQLIKIAATGIFAAQTVGLIKVPGLGEHEGTDRIESMLQFVKNCALQKLEEMESGQHD